MALCLYQRASYFLHLFLVFHVTGVCYCKARFINHVPYDDSASVRYDLDSTVHFDADVKIPGRHHPKLPYLHPFRDHSHHMRGRQFLARHSADGPVRRTTNNFEFIPTYGVPPRHNSHSKSPFDGLQRKGVQGASVNVEGSYHVGRSAENEYFIQGNATTFNLSPSFDRSLPRNVTVQAGKTAILSCRVLNLAEKTVSWIRHDDLHILTVDRYKYSTDQRVSVIYNEVNQEWVLRIRGVTQEDAGRYECQISSKPVLSFIVNMEVVDGVLQTTPYPNLSDQENIEDGAPTQKVPRAHIANAPDVFVHRGSLINLTCIVAHGTERPVFIYWYHKNKVIDYEGERGGITVLTQTGRDTVSQLLVQDAKLEDNGKYTCKPSNGEPASVSLHVLNGEYQAAMHSNKGSRRSTSWPPEGFLLPFFIVFKAHFHLC